MIKESHDKVFFPLCGLFNWSSVELIGLWSIFMDANCFRSHDGQLINNNSIYT